MDIQIIRQARKLIVDGRLKEAIKFLIDIVPEDSSYESSLISLSGQWNVIENNRIMGIASRDELSRQTNKIATSLLYIISRIEEEGSHQQLESSIVREKTIPYATKQSSAFYFHSLKLKNLWSFKNSQTLDLADDHGNPARWTIILGDNGTGKTTLLKCLVELGNFFQSGFDETLSGKREMMKGLSIADIIHLDGSPSNDKHLAEMECPEFFAGKINGGEERQIYDGLALKFAPGRFGRERLFIKKYLPEQHIFAFGASRQMGKGSLSESKNPDPTANLFDPSVPLINAAAWFLETDFALKSTSGEEKKRLRIRFDKIKDLLTRLLPDVEDFRATVPKGSSSAKMQVKTPYGWVEIENLSLGYQTMAAWMIELGVRLFERYPESENPLAEPAIVLVDEIDLHLHPKWQRQLISELTILFPQAQFIVTAHSPLIVQAAEGANIVLLKREGDTVSIYNRKDEDVIKGWRIDQILTSDLFGLESARPPHYDDLLSRQKKLATKSKLSKKDKKELEAIGKELEELEPVPANPENKDLWDALEKANKILQSANLPPGDKDQ